MESSKTAADRIRPYLQAMEESIDSARQKRINDTDTDRSPRTIPKPMEIPPQSTSPQPQRLKARPKRMNNAIHRDNGSTYHTQAS